METSIRKHTPYVSFPPIAGHNSWLDGLRALAIMLVFLRHGIRAMPEPDTNNPLVLAVFNFAQNGWVGVDLFLVLSGYLIGRSLISRFSQNSSLQVLHYFENRILRIVPAYYAVLAAVCLGLFPLYRPPEPITTQSIIWHLLFLQDYLGSNINVVFWSLGVEEKFYILAPLLIILLLKWRSAFIAAAVLAILLIVSPVLRFVIFYNIQPTPDYTLFFQTLRSPFHASLDPLMMGVAIAWVNANNWLRLKPIHALGLMSGAGFTLLIWLSSHEFMAQIAVIDAVAQQFLVALLFTIMVFAATQIGNKRTVPMEPVARVIARLSYALYLVHFPLITLCLAISAALPLPTFPIFWVVYLILSFSVAMLLHFGIEKPFLLLKDKRAHTDPKSANLHISSVSERTN